MKVDVVFDTKKASKKLKVISDDFKTEISVLADKTNKYVEQFYRSMFNIQSQAASVNKMVRNTSAAYKALNLYQQTIKEVKETRLKELEEQYGEEAYLGATEIVRNLEESLLKHSKSIESNNKLSEEIFTSLKTKSDSLFTTSIRSVKSGIEYIYKMMGKVNARMTLLTGTEENVRGLLKAERNTETILQSLKDMSEILTKIKESQINTEFNTERMKREIVSKPEFEKTKKGSSVRFMVDEISYLLTAAGYIRKEIAGGIRSVPLSRPTREVAEKAIKAKRWAEESGSGAASYEGTYMKDVASKGGEDFGSVSFKEGEGFIIADNNYINTFVSRMNKEGKNPKGLSGSTITEDTRKIENVFKDDEYDMYDHVSTLQSQISNMGNDITSIINVIKRGNIDSLIKTNIPEGRDLSSASNFIDNFTRQRRGG